MSTEFKLPDLGEGVHEGRILKLLIPAGAAVSEDQPIMEVETDKAAVEIPSPVAGTIERWHVEEKQLVHVGDVMVTFGSATGRAKAGAGTSQATASASAGGTGKAAAIAEPAPGRKGDAPAHPSAAGTAPNNLPAAGADSSRRRPAASPAVRKAALLRGIDLTRVPGSGPGGRIVMSDLDRGEAHAAPAAPAQRAGATGSAPRPPAPPPPVPRCVDGTPGTDEFGAVVRDDLSLTRRHIARLMSESVRTIPHVTDCDDADVTQLDQLRRGYNGGLREGDIKLSLLPFVVRAVARALVRHPIFNASFDEEKQQIVYRRYVHIAVGMQTPRGLVAPAVRDADRKGIREIAEDLDHLTARCRAGKYETADGAGATYTISNAGAMGGSRYATPIITLPQVAVLAVGRSRLMPWVVDGRIEPRLIMPLSHSMDHRVIDGAEEIAFMRDVIGDLETPARLLL